MEQVVKQLEQAGITVFKFECGYYLITILPLPRLSKSETKLIMYIILDKFHGYELIGSKPGEVKYFRTISELIEYVKK